MDCHGLSWTVMDCHGLPWTNIDCHGLPWTVMEMPDKLCGSCAMCSETIVQSYCSTDDVQTQIYIHAMNHGCKEIK